MLVKGFLSFLKTEIKSHPRSIHSPNLNLKSLIEKTKVFNSGSVVVKGKGAQSAGLGHFLVYIFSLKNRN